MAFCGMDWLPVAGSADVLAAVVEQADHVLWRGGGVAAAGRDRAGHHELEGDSGPGTPWHSVLQRADALVEQMMDPCTADTGLSAV